MSGFDGDRTGQTHQEGRLLAWRFLCSHSVVIPEEKPSSLKVQQTIIKVLKVLGSCWLDQKVSPLVSRYPTYYYYLCFTSQ